eukprot:RCo041206
MIHFTPQQLMGGASYRSSTLVGNWSEEARFAEDLTRHKEGQKQRGELLSQSILGKMKVHNQEVSLTPQHDDEYVHMGDVVMLQCVDTKGYLSVDLDDSTEVVGQGWKYMLTTAPADRPKLRGAWVIQRVETPDDPTYPPEHANVLHYHQPFKLALLPELYGAPKGSAPQLFLHTEPVTGSCFSKVTRNQEVVALGGGTSDLLWCCEYLDQNLRMEMEGQPIRANAVLVVNHVLTNQPLCSMHTAVHVNDFGREFEVCASSQRGTGTKKRSQPEQPPNHWALITGPPSRTSAPGGKGGKPSSSSSSSPGPSPSDVEIVMGKLRKFLVSRTHPTALRKFSRVLRVLTEGGQRPADPDEVNNALLTCKVSLNPPELAVLCAAFRSGEDGRVDVLRLLDVLRGEFPAARGELLRQAFALVTQGSGTTTVGELVRLHDPRKHPDVLNRTKAEATVRQEFLTAWDQDASTSVTLDDFLEYYVDVGACIRDEDFFELMVRNCWHLSGGTGISKNSSCRRVLVTHTDGSQTVEEVKNDLHIGLRDDEAVRQNLLSQGIKDIKRIQPYS